MEVRLGEPRIVLEDPGYSSVEFDWDSEFEITNRMNDRAAPSIGLMTLEPQFLGQGLEGICTLDSTIEGTSICDFSGTQLGVVNELTEPIPAGDTLVIDASGTISVSVPDGYVDTMTQLIENGPAYVALIPFIGAGGELQGGFCKTPGGSQTVMEVWNADGRRVDQGAWVAPVQSDGLTTGPITCTFT